MTPRAVRALGIALVLFAIGCTVGGVALAVASPPGDALAVLAVGLGGLGGVMLPIAALLIAENGGRR